MKKFWGIWLPLYFIVAYFVYQWIWNWRNQVECYPNNYPSADCTPQTLWIKLLLLVIIPFIGFIIGLVLWKKQNIVSKILTILSLIAIIYFFVQYLTPPMMG